MREEQRTRALRLADVLDSFYQREVLETASFLRELAAEPRKRTEEDAFEDWLEKECPSGDVDEVQRKWEASEALAELLDEQRKQAEPVRVPLTDEQAFDMEAVGWAYSKCVVFGLEKGIMESAMLMDRLKLMLEHGITGDAK